MLGAFQLTLCGLCDLDTQPTQEITHVVSILDPDSPSPKAFATFARRRRLELRFHDVLEPEPRVVPPERQHVQELLAFGSAMIARKTAVHLLIHCHAGLSRSTAAAILYLTQAHPRRSVHQSFGEVVRLRRGAWPNLRLLELGDEALGRQGEIVAAAGAFYRRALDANPHLGDHLVRSGRCREVAWAEQWR